jgi:hypothetical protein
MRRAGYSANSQMGSKPSAGPIIGGTKSKPSDGGAVGAGNSP